MLSSRIDIDLFILANEPCFYDSFTIYHLFLHTVEGDQARYLQVLGLLVSSGSI